MDISAVTAGLNVAQTRFEKAATGIASAAVEPDSVSLSQQAVDLLSAKNQVGVDLKVTHIADEMQKSLLNLLG